MSATDSHKTTWRNDKEVFLETVVAQSLKNPSPGTQTITPSIYPSTTYARTVTDEGYTDGRLYARDENPMYEEAEEVLAKLEGGNRALVFGSGMAAAAAMVHALPARCHIVAPKVAFIGFVNLLKRADSRGDFRVSWYDNNCKESLAKAVQDDTAMIFVETPGNPTWEVTDIAYAADLARKVGAKLTVDNTIPTPILTRPFELGADYIWHSATKYLNGHHDVVAGCIMAKETDAYVDEIHYLRRLHGGTLGAFETWLLMRGMQTLYLRVKTACENAMAIAAFLENHPQVEAVKYPGLKSHPEHDIAKRQMRGGFGSMLSFLIKGGKTPALKLMQNLNVFQCATSLGGTASLIDHRKTIEGEDSPLPDNLLRLSIGTEHPNDLIYDLKQGFKAVVA